VERHLLGREQASDRVVERRLTRQGAMEPGGHRHLDDDHAHAFLPGRRDEPRERLEVSREDSGIDHGLGIQVGDALACGDGGGAVGAVELRLALPDIAPKAFAVVDL